MKKITYLLIIITCITCYSQQNISLFNQFNGRYDFTFVGNTLNPFENSAMPSPPTILTTSSAILNLQTNDQIEAAYLYWAGCGTGDFDIQLNGNPISATRNFSNQLIQIGNTYNFFSAFADVTNIVQNNGNGTYTVSDLDVSSFVPFHYNNRTNFAGWAIIVVYKNTILPLNQLNIYDGLQVVSIQQNFLDVQLNNLNVIDNQDAKIGFIAWEGDSQLAVNETLRINGNILSNPPLNPANNAFNGTNSVTNSNQLNNMDLDIYNIQNNIGIGDTSALIQLTSGQDYVMVNTIVTKLNSQLPDATIIAQSPNIGCNEREFNLNYEVRNFNSTEILPANTPIAFYADGQLIGTTQTLNDIAIGGFETGSILLQIPIAIPLNFNLTIIVDDTGSGNGVVTELNEINNNTILNIQLIQTPDLPTLPNLQGCNLGLTTGEFNLTNNEALLPISNNDIVSYHLSENDAQNDSNPILIPDLFYASSTPMVIWIRVEFGIGCYEITSFNLNTINCPPIIYNAVSPNGDGMNDFFFIKGLRNIFTNFKLEIYNRWGKLIWTGDNNKEDWYGQTDNGIGSELAPGGTYYYILYLNDPAYPEPLNGYVYLKK